MKNELISKIFNIGTAQEFQAITLEVFRFQAENNSVYKEYIEHLNIDPEEVNNIDTIPFLPINFFKTHEVKAFEGDHEEIFTSSGTTGMTTSQHFVWKTEIYKRSFLTAFEQFYGSPTDYCIVALLPGYLEREGSSLVYMVKHLIDRSEHTDSGFYLHDHTQLVDLIKRNEEAEQKTLLIGVSFALLDLIEKYQLQLRHTTIMETGGMKGRRKELTRQELHLEIKNGLGVDNVHSEYGMTELLSQAYSLGNLRFSCPPWMKIMIRDTYDPFGFLSQGRTGGINVIDLANLYSCSFIETMDLGKIHDDGQFEVLGRFDNSDVRGCNLMVE